MNPVHSFTRVSIFVIGRKLLNRSFHPLLSLGTPQTHQLSPQKVPSGVEPMPNPSARSKSVKIQHGGGVRGRDAEFPGAPIRVPGYAQPKVIDIAATRPFEPSQMERNKLPERPSTSGGPAANSSMRRNGEKRETKDDLHFNPRGAAGSGTTFYNFPLPGSLPTPSSTPRSSPPVRTSSLPRSDTPDSMDGRTANLNVPQMEIGMALGSPTHQPTNWQTHAPFESTARNETPDSLDTYVDNESHVAAPAKQKTSKWKIFGGLFGGAKKNPGGSPQAFYQLQPEGSSCSDECRTRLC